MKSVRIEPALHFGDEVLEPAFFDLLRAIGDSGSLAAAARDTRVSYRHAWGQMRRWEAAVGQSLARLQRGRGAELTAAGEALLRLQRQVGERVAPVLTELEASLRQDLDRAGKAPHRSVVIHASHDLALARLRDTLDPADAPDFDLHFHGSLENLVALSRGQCDIAGFHVAEQLDAPEVRRLLRPKLHAVIGVALREQGLMVARGNPKEIQGLSDLTRRNARFVNRQQGSGTRIAFDQLLDHAGIDPDRINGYANEEFTHLAVAATIAGGMADAGFGIRAAAVQYGLGFIPIVTERYLFACRSHRLQDPAIRKFLALLRGNRFRGILAELPGYDDAIAGKIMDVGLAIAGPRPARRGQES
jgi:putative molybdopterin biosynthesis protein